VPAQLKLWDTAGTELGAVDLPAAPIPAGIAVAGQHIVVATEDGVLHRITTSPQP
jgi:hypothetical protein